MPEASNPSRPGHGLAIAALVCGILGILCFLPAAIAAIVLGSLSVSHASRAPEPRPGTGMARAGRALGIAGVAIFAIGLLAIPPLLGPHGASPAAGAVGSLRTINTAQVQYSTMYPKVGFSPSLAVLGSGGTDCKQPSEQHACLIDDTLASGRKHDYRFRYAAVKTGDVFTAYTAQADPIPQPPTWWDRLFHTAPAGPRRHFFTDESAVIRSDLDREAGPQSPPL